ncbi:hypothetical protein [Aquimarina latercula]|uniref:hypothetical protein n=1 Tax=Aquimarina latercula TaxID=987 RepID=UPI000408855A|nr:hypothetical protein [Aquimarina latercula]
MSHQGDKDEISELENDKRVNLFFIERLGYFLVLISGILPFLHSFIKHETLEEKLFGFTSVQSFLYSFGVHLSILFLVIGVLCSISVASSASKYKTIQSHLRYTLISPFVSAVFYNTWVFIPNVNYDLLAYIFLTLFICSISVLIFYRIYKYIETLKLVNKHKETVLNNGLTYLKSKLNRNK